MKILAACLLFVATTNLSLGGQKTTTQEKLGYPRSAKLLIIHADDDPWIPSDAYRALDWDGNPQLRPQLLGSGGHVGFHARGLAMPWHDAALLQWLERL